MAQSQNHVAKLYQTVIEDVINNVREAFLDDGVDEQVLQELKQIWENKLDQSKAVDSPILGDRPQRPHMYTYMTQPGGQQTVTQPIVYQAIPAQTVQLSGASQQARLALPEGVVYQQQVGGLVVPTQQIYTAYQPVTVLPQAGVQASQGQTRQVPGTGQTIVLASTSQPGISQQQNVSGSQQPSAIIQVDGSNDVQDDEEGPSTSGMSCGGCKKSTKIIKVNKKRRPRIILQVDGGNDSSSSEDDDDNEDDDDDEDDDDEDEDDTQGEEGGGTEQEEEEAPLCSDDDDSDQDASELFDTDNVVVCQYDKIHRSKAKWKFNLKVGIMNLKGKDHVFQKAVGEADW